MSFTLPISATVLLPPVPLTLTCHRRLSNRPLVAEPEHHRNLHHPLNTTCSIEQATASYNQFRIHHMSNILNGPIHHCQVTFTIFRFTSLLRHRLPSETSVSDARHDHFAAREEVVLKPAECRRNPSSTALQSHASNLRTPQPPHETPRKTNCEYAAQDW